MRQFFQVCLCCVLSDAVGSDYCDTVDRGGRTLQQAVPLWVHLPFDIIMMKAAR